MHTGRVWRERAVRDSLDQEATPFDLKKLPIDSRPASRGFALQVTLRIHGVNAFQSAETGCEIISISQ